MVEVTCTARDKSGNKVSKTAENNSKAVAKNSAMMKLTSDIDLEDEQNISCS